MVVLSPILLLTVLFPMLVATCLGVPLYASSSTWPRQRSAGDADADADADAADDADADRENADPAMVALRHEKHSLQARVDPDRSAAPTAA
jgi:hypothetical protein